MGWMRAIIQNESRGNPLAINVNGSQQLAHAPQSTDQAMVTATWLLQHGYNFDAGISQVNSANFKRLNLGVKDLFDPCTNIKAAAHLFAQDYRLAYQQTRDPNRAVLNAISMYNTGSQSLGFANGYVKRIVDTAVGEPDVIPLVRKGTEKPTHPQISNPQKKQASSNPFDVYNKPSKPDQSKVY